ncbi:MAG: VanW family protein [Clostridia bacterium]|nr:VanW family protein [Clostridia bacterium]
MKIKLNYCLCFILLCFLCIFGGSFQKTDDITITITYKDNQIEWNDKFLKNSAVFDFFGKAQKNGRLGSNKQRAELVEKIVLMGFSYEQAFCYVFPTLKEKINDLCLKIDKKEVDATVKFNPNSDKLFSYTKDYVGYKVNKENLYKNILEKLKFSTNPKIEINPEVLRPKVTKQELIKGTKLVAKFETDYENSSENRKNNIKLAIKNFNGLILKPHTEYSFNKITGKRTEEKGYREANIIINNEYVEGFGGGVCQASTTLYNALLLADINVIESHPHSLKSSYIMCGFDAMVNYGASDLRWRNENSYPLYIKTYATNTKVGVEIYGYKLNYEIERETKLINKTKLDDVIVEDDTMFLGEERYKVMPKTGCKVKSFLTYKQNGKIIKQKQLRTQSYKAVRGVKLVGTKVDKLESDNKTFVNWQQN